ncbi:MAG: hypothetical protein MR346_03680, partial [Clostridium sp.]|nr:hypothetical protein [Clostridium sp.]
GSNNWLSQLAFNTDDTIWHRSKVNSGGWTNWTKLVKTTDLNNYLPKSGGTITGDITAQAINVGNNCPIRGRETSNGLYKTLVYMNGQNQVVLGSGSNSVTIQIPALDKLAIWDDSTKKSYNIYHSGNDPWRIKTLGKKDMDTTLNSRGQGFLMKEAYNGTSSGYPKAYGNVLRMGGTGSNELFFEWCDGTAGMIYHRCLRDIGTSWTPWRRLAYADELSGYLPKSGGTMKGELALTQDKGIVSANVEGGTLLVETSSSVNVGKITKDLTLNCSRAYLNGARVLTDYNYASYVLPKIIFAGVFSPDKTIGTDSNTFYGYSKKTVYKSADCTVGTDRITISKGGVYKVTATWGGVPKSGTANTSAMRFIIQQRNSSAAIASKLDTITVTTLNREAKSTISGLFECSANDYFIIFSYLCTVTFESKDVEIEIVRIS